jgi:hypothetical protein
MNMKKLIAVLITIIMALSLTACGETSAPAVVPSEFPSEEGWQVSAVHEPDGVVDEPTPTPEDSPRLSETPPSEREATPRLSETPPSERGTPPREKISPEWFIRNADAGSVFGILPHFDDPNTIPLSTLLPFAQKLGEIPSIAYSDEDIERLFGDYRDSLGYEVLGYKPEDADAFLKENFNPGFSIESHDYRSFDFRTNTDFFDVTWDEEAGMLVTYMGVSGGFPIYVNEIVDFSLGYYYKYFVASYWVDGYSWDEKYRDFDYVRKYAPLIDIEYNLYTFARDVLLSKLPYFGSETERLRLHEIFDDDDFSVLYIDTPLGETVTVYNEFNAVNRTTAAHCIEFASGAAHLLFMLDMDYNNVMNWTAHDIYDAETADIFNNKTLTSVLQFTVIERGRIADKDPLLDTVIAFAIFDDERYRVEMCFAPGGQYFDVMESVVSVFLAAS